MANLNEEADIGVLADKAPTAAVYAAMMEELGLARKDTLPLEDKKGLPGRVDLDALDRGKKANDPRSAEYKIAKENASAHLAWKNAKFGDVDPEDLNLDQMDSGQSHRLRMKIALEASHHLRDSYATRGGRGARTTRGGGSHSLSRMGRSNRRSDAKSDRINFDRALSRLGGRLGSNGTARSGTRGVARSSNSKLAGRTSDIAAPKGTFSFDYIKERTSSRPVTREGQAARKLLKANNYNQGFGLASPEDFLSQTLTSNSANKVLLNVKEGILRHDRLPPAASKTPKPATTILNPETSSIRNIEATSTIPVGIQESLRGSDTRGLANNTHDVIHSSQVQIGNVLGEKIIMIGSGNFRIKTVNRDTQIAKVIQIEHEGKTLLEEPLLEGIEFHVEICTISFHSYLKGESIKWILIASKPETASDLLQILEQHKLLPTRPSSYDNFSKDRNGKTAAVEDVDNLISYLEEDPVSPPIVSKFEEDLLSLMGTPLIEDVLASTGANQGSLSLVSSTSTGNSAFGENHKHRNAFCGLEKSRYAETSKLSGIVDKPTVSRKLSESATPKREQQADKRLLEETQKHIVDRRASHVIKPAPPRQYTIEELISLRRPNSSTKKSFLTNSYSKRLSDCEPRFLFHFPELGVPSVSGSEILQKPSGLAKAKHASPDTERLLGKVAESRDTDNAVSKPIQELSQPKSHDLRAMNIVPRLSTRKIGCQKEGKLIQGPVETTKSEVPGTNWTRNFTNSDPHPPHAVKAFQSFAKSSSHSELTPLSKVELSASKPLSDPTGKKYHVEEPSNSPEHQLANSFTKLSTSGNDEGVLSKGIAEFSKLNSPERPANKLHQGLSTSRYASPFQPKHKTKRAVPTMTQIVLKPPGFVDRLPMPAAAIPDVANEIAFRTDLATTNSKWRESSTSHASKDLGQKMKLPTQEPYIEPDLDHDLFLRFSPKPPNRHLLLIADSLSSCTSNMTQVEGSIQKGGIQTTYFQPRISDFVLFPNSDAVVSTGVTDFSGVSSHSKDMSELMEYTQSAAPQSVLTNTEHSTSKSSESSKAPTENPLARAKAGLMSSRYAASPEATALCTGMDESQSSTAEMLQTAKNSPNTRRTIPSLPSSGPKVCHRSRALQATASQFTPLAAKDTTIQEYTIPPPAMGPLSQLMQPAMATVLVPDLQRPGFLSEVCGYLKMSSTPIVGFVVSENSLMSEGLAPANGVAHTVSPRTTLELAQRPALSLMLQDSGNVAKRQQEVQECLSNSLAKRRPSQSPGHISY